jgi:hypothetical protein
MAIFRAAKVVSVGSALLIVIGCGHRFETGYQDFNKVQVQFYQPTGATVTLGQCNFGTIAPNRSHQVNIYESQAYRLEHQPEETATFNLCPGSYEFKYTGAQGWEGASIYGEIQIHAVCCLTAPGAKAMLKRVFIPIALPSPGTTKAVSSADDLFPYTSPAHRLRISYQDVDRIMAGDMVTKVVFIADLKKAKCDVNRLEVEFTCMQGKQQRLRALLNEAQLDALDNPKSDEFIEIQCQLKELEQKMDRNRDKYTRLNALLNADKVIIRREMMVLATDEILPAHEDPICAAQKIGQVVMVIRLGGRHMQWGNSAQEAAVFNQ